MDNLVDEDFTVFAREKRFIMEDMFSVGKKRTGLRGGSNAYFSRLGCFRKSN